MTLAVSLAASLAQLEFAQLVRRLSEPELEYMFKHALVHDVVYESLLKQERRQLHQTVGEVLERIYPQRIDELAPMLAQHFDEAGDARALRYYTQAGDAAMRRYAKAEAIKLYTSALKIAVAGEAREMGAPSTVLTRLYLERGRAMEQSGRYAEALASYEEMEATARARNDRSIELASLIARATIRSAPTSTFDTSEGQALSDRALTLAHELGDRAAEAKVLWNLMLHNKFTQQWRPAVQHGEKSIALARELNLRELLAYALNDIYSLYIAVGRMDRAQAALSESLALWHELDNRPMLTDSLTGSANMSYLWGNFEQGLKLADEAHRISLEIDILWGQSYSLWVKGMIQFELGDCGDAIQAWEESYCLGKQAGFAVSLINTQCYLAWAYAELGACERGIQVARTVIENIPNLPAAWLGAARATLAMCQICAGKLDEAEALIHVTRRSQMVADMNTAYAGLAELELSQARGDSARAIPITEQFFSIINEIHALMFEPYIHYYAGVAHFGLSDDDRASAHLSKARVRAEALHSRRVLWRIYAALAQLEAQHGNPAEAQAWRDKSREVIHYIANRTGSDALRVSFLSKPDVREITATT